MDFIYCGRISQSSLKSFWLRQNFGCVMSFYFRLFGTSTQWELPELSLGHTIGVLSTETFSQPIRFLSGVKGPINYLGSQYASNYWELTAACGRLPRVLFPTVLAALILSADIFLLSFGLSYWEENEFAVFFSLFVMTSFLA